MAEVHIRERKRVFCPHCDDFVSKSLYYRHKHLYFENENRIWTRMQPNNSSEFCVSFEFSPDSPIQSENGRLKNCQSSFLLCPVVVDVSDTDDVNQEELLFSSNEFNFSLVCQFFSLCLVSAFFICLGIFIS